MTTKLPLPEVIFNTPSEIDTYTTRWINIEAYSSLPECNDIENLSTYLGYSLDTLKYEWS